MAAPASGLSPEPGSPSMKTSKPANPSLKSGDSSKHSGPAEPPGESPKRNMSPKRAGGPAKSPAAAKDAGSAKPPTGGAAQKPRRASLKREAGSTRQAPAGNAPSSKPVGASATRGGSPKRDAVGTAPKPEAAPEPADSSKQGGPPAKARSAQGAPYEDESKSSVTLGSTLLRAAAIATVTIILCVLMMVTWRVLASPMGGHVMEPALLDSSANDSESRASRPCNDTETCADPYEALFRDSVDTGASPCSNFYEYACGAWMRNHNVSSAATTWRKLARIVAQRFREEKVAARRGQPVAEAARFLETCLNTGGRPESSEGIPVDDVRNILAEAGLTWPDWSERSDFVSSLFFMARRVALPVFFGIEVGYSENRLRAMLFPLDVPFNRILRRFVQHMKTDRAKEVIRAAYETFTAGAFDGQRCDAFLSTMRTMSKVLDAYANAADKKQQCNITSLGAHAPTVTAEKWGSLVQRYHKVYFSDLEAIVVYDVASFAGIFEALQNRGEEIMNDVLGFLSVLAAVHYTNTSLRDTFFGSADEAVVQQEQYCFARAYKFYEHAMNHFLLGNSQLSLDEIRFLADKMSSVFLHLIGVNDTVSAGVSPLNQGYNLRSVFEGFEKSRPEFFAPHYARYPNLTASALQNWMSLVEYKMKTGALSLKEFAEEGSERDWAGQCGTAFYKWRLTPCHLGFPWYSANGHRGAFLAGIGTRIAAALFLDYVDRNASSRLEVYQRNDACLRAGAPLSDTSLDLGLQASVAAVRAAWTMSEDEAATNASLFPEVGPVTPPRVFFLFGCHLFCGESEGARMCNVPLRHSAAFARVFACRRESAMNPARKCTMLI
ncbi:hypothetical protein V5799_021906 [Amblyomma americanum]|uniref:Peptidase M13 N-terminal domain-containing protein n=1 Tax=Amblyomma americanum TaxID=6943 RepID=A0AAQ4FPF4_AMBAM